MKTQHGPSFFENNLDLLRILAALQVLIVHSMHSLAIPTPIWLEPLIVLRGVPVFFVVSGFLVSSSFERRGSLFDYARKRFLRIYPALWVCILATVLVAALFGFSFASLPAAAWLTAQFAGAIYTPSFLDSFGMGSYNASLWTIPVELQFYLVLPIIYLVAGRFNANSGFVLIFILFVSTAAIIHFIAPNMGNGAERSYEKLLRYSFLPHVYLFAFGILLQRFRVYLSPFVAGKGGYWLISYIALALALHGNKAAEIPLMLMLGATAISLAYTAPKTGHALLRGNDISYGVYIYNGLVMNILVQLKMSQDPILILVILASSVFLAILSWKFVERPILKMKKQRNSTQFEQGSTAQPITPSSVPS